MSFILEQIELPKKEAIALAVTRATETARLSAESAGLALGPVASIKPRFVTGRPAHYRFDEAEEFMREATLRSSDETLNDYSPSIEAGELEVVASVTMRFKIRYETRRHGEEMLGPPPRNSADERDLLLMNSQEKGC